MPAPLDVLLAGEALVPHPGGAERFALELLGVLANRGHRVRALVLGEPDLVEAWARLASGVELLPVAPPDDAGDMAWRRRRRRGERMREVVAETLARERPDAVIGQLYAGGGAVAAARARGVPAALLLSGYEALCHWAFQIDSRCLPASRCRDCPRALELPPDEREELLRVRAEQDAALAGADILVAPSATMADACERLMGRRPHVAAPVTAAPPPARARLDGPLVAAASHWTREKGVGLLAPLARRLTHRRLLVAAPNGLAPADDAELRSLPTVTVRRRPAGIAELLDGAGGLLVPSQLPEPFGRVAFEGLAAGVPTLASATGGLAEHVPPAQLVDPPDLPAAWERAVRGLEDVKPWEAARARGRDAAAAVLASDPPGRIEGWLRAVA